MAHFWCRIVGPDYIVNQCIAPGHQIKVDARGYESAARCHVRMDAPRVSLMVEYVDVEVMAYSALGEKVKVVRVQIDCTSKVVKR